MFTKILGCLFLLCLVSLFGVGLYEIYLESGIGWTLTIATVTLGFATWIAWATEEWLC